MLLDGTRRLVADERRESLDAHACQTGEVLRGEKRWNTPPLCSMRVFRRVAVMTGSGNAWCVVANVYGTGWGNSASDRRERRHAPREDRFVPSDSLSVGATEEDLVDPQQVAPTRRREAGQEGGNPLQTSLDVLLCQWRDSLHSLTVLVKAGSKRGHRKSSDEVVAGAALCTA